MRNMGDAITTAMAFLAVGGIVCLVLVNLVIWIERQAVEWGRAFKGRPAVGTRPVYLVEKYPGAPLVWVEEQEFGHPDNYDAYAVHLRAEIGNEIPLSTLPIEDARVINGVLQRRESFVNG